MRHAYGAVSGSRHVEAGAVRWGAIVRCCGPDRWERGAAMLHAHRAMCTIACVLFLIVAAPSFAHAETQQISVDDLDRLLVSGVTLIDVRRADEWRATGIVAGSRMITAFDSQGNLDPRFVEAITTSFPPDRPVALICRSGNRSATAAQLLSERLGYQHVFNVQGGIQQWIQERRPIAACPSC